MKYKITKALILTLASNQDVFRRGEKYFNDNKVLEMSVEKVRENNAEVVHAKVDGAYKRFNVACTFDENGEFRRYSCDCDANAVWKGSCKHVVAVLFALSVKSRIADAVWIRTDAAHNILHFFEASLYGEIEKEITDCGGTAYKAELVPCVELIENRAKGMYASVKLKIGFDQLYAVRNIRNLLKDVQNESTVSYGKGLSFKHAYNAFGDSSRALLKLLGGYNNILNELAILGSGADTGALLNGAVVLTPMLTDAFFDIYSGSEVEVNENAVLFEENPPDIKFRAVFEEKSVRLIARKIPFKTLAGEKFMYFLIGRKLHRIEARQGKCLQMLLNEMSALKTDEITFAKGDFAKCVSFVLPILNKMNMVEVESSLDQDIKSVPLVPKLYFDSKQKSVLCKVNFCYGESLFNPLTDESGGNEPNASIFIRDTFQEANLIGRLKKYGFEADGKSGSYVLQNDGMIFDFHLNGLKELNEMCEVYLSKEFSARAVKPVKKASFGVRLSGNLLHMSLGELDFSQAELFDAISSYQLKKRYFRLKDGSFLNLDDENFKTYGDTIAAFNFSKKELSSMKSGEIVMPVYRSLFISSLFDNEKQNVTFDDNFNNLIHSIKNYGASGAGCPASLASVLRGYQTTGFKWLKMLLDNGFSGILADEMGLGKTLQVITLLLSEKERGCGQSLVVTPTSLMYNWAHEIEKFAPGLTTSIIAGLPAKRKELLETNADVLITTYDMLKRDISNYANREFNCVIADEAQYIKNPVTQNAVALKQLKSRARFALTGTPLENSLSELWSIFDFIMPGYLYSADRFSKFYEAPIVKNDDKVKTEQLKKQISPFILRRMKSDVLKELPDKVETFIYSEMLPEQQKVYSAFLLEARGELEQELNNNTPQSRMKILSLLTRLRQICCHPATFIDNYKGGSGKLDLAAETILSAVESGHRLLLFSQFTSMLSILKKTLDDRKISYYYLDGATNALLRSKMVTKFNEGEKDLFLISLKAGGTGLNLAGADIVIHYDEWWNPAVMSQATDRAHRIGQSKVVQVIHLITKDTIEEKIINLQNRKKMLVDSVLLQDTKLLTKMTTDEIRELFL